MNHYISIENTDLKLFRLIMGTVNAGLSWDKKDAFKVLDHYVASGGNTIDLARVYSNWVKPELNRAERVIGDWIKHRKGSRDLIIITKGGHPELDTMNISRLSKEEMTKDLNGSLQKLGVGHIDLYFYHRDDISQPVDAHIELMESFVKEGKIRYYACSNWTVERIKAADAYCYKHGYRGFVANQALFNMAVFTMNPFPDKTMVAVDEEMLQYHTENRSNVLMPYMALCSGFYHSKAQGKDVSQSPYNTEGCLALETKIQDLQKKYKASISQVLLGFCLYQKFSICPLFSADSIEQMEDTLKTLDIPFTENDFC